MTEGTDVLYGGGVPGKTARSMSVPKFLNAKGQERLVVLTAFSARMAELMAPHCDAIIVGDSLAQVVYGLPTTLPVSLDMMCAHGAAVVRGAPQSLVVVDLPFGTYEESPEAAYRSAVRVMRETGAKGVKIEGGNNIATTIEFLVDRGIPVMGHAGLTPQDVNSLGGYGARGRSEQEYQRILSDSRAVCDAGAFSIVVEGVVEPLARQITEAVTCPTLGIGGSPACDGQVLVTEDMLGMFERTARFVKKYEQFGDRADHAFAEFSQAVRDGSFPGPEHLYPLESPRKKRAK